MPRASLPGTLPSPGPIRRRSLLARYVSTGSTTTRSIEDEFNKKLNAQATQHSNLVLLKASPRVPTELLDHIITLFTVFFCLPVPTRNTAFALIKPLTLVSKSFRHLVLRHYFAILVLSNKSSIGLFRFLENEDEAHRRHGWTGGFVWVRSVSQAWLPIGQFNAYIIIIITKNGAYTRSLYAFSDVLLSEANLAFTSFRLLKDLWIDFRREGLMTQRPVLNFLFKSITNGFLNLTSLTMTAVPRLDTHLLKIVAQIFPSLIELHLSTVESLIIDCCPSCLQDSLTRSTHSPVPDIYPNVEMLAVRTHFFFTTFFL
jgi:hypothetical protein